MRTTADAAVIYDRSMRGALAAVTILLCTAFVWPSQAQTTGAERRVALVIGNSAYKTGALRNPVNDARDMATALRGVGFEVIDRYDATKREMNRAVSEFGDQLARGGVGLFYFAGHGVQSDSRNFLLAVDSDIEIEADIESETADIARVLGRMASAGNWLNVVILDACRNNPYARKFRSPARGLAVTPAPTGTYIAYATAPGDVAADGDGRNGVFTAALLTAMRKPGLELDGLFKDVRSNVVTATRNRQVPWTSSSVTGDFYFRPGPVPPSPGSASPIASLPPPSAPPAPVLDPVEKEMVASRNANVRTAPETGASVVETLPAGSRVHVAGKVAGSNWYLVERDKKKLGYVFGDLLQEAAPAPPPAQQQAVVTPPRPPAQPSPAQPAVGVYPQTQQFRPGQTFRDCAECPELVVVPAGSFTMGSPQNEKDRDSDEGPQRAVTIARAFGVGKFEITFAEWDACVVGGGCSGYRPSDQGWGRGTRPVINVSWDDAKGYVEWLGRKTGKPYWLLSEAEWEYAARAGTTTPFHTGATITPEQANYNGDYTYANGPKGVYRQRTVEVGQFPANGFGLHDMHGNMREWVEDCWHDSYAGAPADGGAWLTDGNCGSRVLRGGSWYSNPRNLRSADRSWGGTGNRYPNVGFRVARTLN